MKTQLRRTKIVATLGPASVDRIPELIKAGANIFRLNFSHGSHEVHAESVRRIREAEASLNTRIGILADLQGPKIRVEQVVDEGVMLVNGEEFIITTESVIGQGNRVSCGYKTLHKEVEVGNMILMDDGKRRLRIKEIKGQDIITEVITGGKLTSRKGINLPDAPLKTPALTEKDLEDLKFIVTQDVDFVALSFVRSGHDLDYINDKMNKLGKMLPVISKIEKPEALEDIDAIIEKSFGIMVARGDLGVEIAQERVPTVQKNLIRKCLKEQKPCIVATQMLESMTENPCPTRAEVTDVANAVLDGTSAVMLSGESAAGDFPIESVETMASIIVDAEENFLTKQGVPGVEQPEIKDQLDALANSVSALNDNLNAKAIVCISESGRTAKRMASFRPSAPVIALAEECNPVIRQLTLYRGVIPCPVPSLNYSEENLRELEKAVDNTDMLEDGDQIIITAAMPLKRGSGTNLIKIHKVGDKGNGMF